MLASMNCIKYRLIINLYLKRSVFVHSISRFSSSNERFLRIVATYNSNTQQSHNAQKQTYIHADPKNF